MHKEPVGVERAFRCDAAQVKSKRGKELRKKMKNQTSFEDLQVYKDGLALLVDVYSVLQNSELKIEFGLSEQLKRATLSITNNIAEGYERETDKELIRFCISQKALQVK